MPAKRTSGHIVQDEGTSLGQAAFLDFVGSGVSVATASGKTTVTIAGGSGTPLDGWVDDTAATWTRTADQTFTVTGDRTAVFQKGTRLKWTQTTVKYGVVISSSHAAGTTTVTIATTTDYVLTAAAISANYYSYMASPEGYPNYFNFTPGWTSDGTPPAIVNGTLEGKFSMIGATVHAWVEITMGSSTTFGTGNYSVPLPIPRLAASPAFASGQVSGYSDLSGGFTVQGAWRGDGFLNYFLVNVNIVRQGLVTPTAPFTWQTTDIISLSSVYEAA